MAVLLVGLPVCGQAQTPKDSEIPRADRPARAASSEPTTRTLLRGIIIAARDITRPTRAIVPAAPIDPCAARPVGRRSSAVPESRPALSPLAPLPPLSTDEAAARYRADMAAQGPIVQEGRAGRPDPALVTLLEPFLGRPLNSTLTAEISRAVVAYLNAEARQLSDVYFPAQDVSDGVLVLVVAPAVLGKIVTKGQQHTPSDALACRIRVAPGDVVDPQIVAADLAALNRSPWRRTEAAFAPGADVGQTDIVLTTVDERPLRFVVGGDNAGSRITGLARYRAGVSVGSPFGLFDHRIDYTYLSAANRRLLNGHLLGYSLPLDHRDTLSASASYFRTNADLQDGAFQSSGSNSTFGLQWSRFPRRRFPLSGGRHLRDLRRRRVQARRQRVGIQSGVDLQYRPRRSAGLCRQQLQLE